MTHETRAAHFESTYERSELDLHVWHGQSAAIGELKGLVLFSELRFYWYPICRYLSFVLQDDGRLKKLPQMKGYCFPNCARRQNAFWIARGLI